MRRLIIVAVTAGAIATLSVVFAPRSSTASRDPFIGAWEATDAGDLSHMQVMIGRGGGGTYRVTWVEDYFTGCEVAPDLAEPGIAHGTGTKLDANLLRVNVSIWCPTIPRLWTGVIQDFTYDSITDTLLNEAAVGGQWTRVGR
jgi:hypothetical protein